MQPDEAFKKAFDWQLSSRILAYLKPYKFIVVLALICTTLIAVLQPLFGLLQKHAIDCFLVVSKSCNANTSSTPEKLFQGLLMLGGLYLGMKILEFGLRYAFTYTLSWLGQHVLYDIRSSIFSKLQRLHLSYYDQNPVGRLITRVTSDVDAINQFITNGLASLITSSFLVIAYIIIMLWIDWRLALVSFVVLPFFYLLSNFFRTKIRDTSRETRLRQAIVNTQLNENITGMLTVQLFNRERRNQAKFDHANRDLLQALINSIVWFSLYMPSTQLLAQISVGLVIWYGGFHTLVDGTISLGTLIAFIGWVGQLFQPIQDLADVFNNLQTAMASSERIFGVLDTEEKIRDPEQPVPLQHFQGHVQLKNVWFAYDHLVDANTPDDDPRWILRGIDLDIAAGESVALVGATGAGKTSIISLVARFYDVQRGQVAIDGVDVRDYAQQDVRSHIGIVLQDVFLFAGTIESNLRMGRQDISLERLIEVCQYVGVHEFIMQLPNGYQTEVRERGATLSTGQKQLLAMARALIQNPDVVMILDEATANIDTDSEERIQAALNKLMHDRTSIVIAHRLSTIEHCDRIVVLRKGKVIEQGKHQALLNKGGYYARLHALQYVNQ